MELHGYRNHDGMWLDRAGRPAGPFTRRRLDRAARRLRVPFTGGPERGPDDGPGAAGVREPRRPLDSPPSMAAEADLPT